MRNSNDPDFLSIALAEPSRRALLETLRFGRKSVTELVQATHLKQPNVSNHLAKMRQQGIVRAERIGRQVYYSLSMPFADVLMRMHEMAAHPGPDTGLDSPEHGSNASTGARYAEGAASGATEDADARAYWRSAYFESIFSGLEDQAVSLVNSMLAQRLGMETIYIDVFQPSINQIGEMYVRGETDEAHEHMASAITERMMARVAQFYEPVMRSTHRALLGCVAGNWHMLGARMLSDGLRGMGWETIFLGADVPTHSFVSMAEAMRPHLVVISCALADQLHELENLTGSLRALRARSDDPPFVIAVGGRVLHDHPDQVTLEAGDISAPDLPHFLSSVRDRFNVKDSV